MKYCYVLEEEFVHDYCKIKAIFEKEETAIKAAEDLLNSKSPEYSYSKSSKDDIEADYRKNTIHRWSNGGYETFYLRVYKFPLM